MKRASAKRHAPAAPARALGLALSALLAAACVSTATPPPSPLPSAPEAIRSEPSAPEPVTSKPVAPESDGAPEGGEGVLTVSTPVAVSADRPDLPHIEPHLAAHPQRPELLLGAAVTFPEATPPGGLDDTIVAGFRSTDGGASWTRFPLPGCRIDPWTIFTGDRVLLGCIDRDYSILVHTSADDGVTWTTAPVPRGEGTNTDRPVLAAAPDGGAVHAVFGQWFPAPGLEKLVFGPSVSTSMDGGRTFAEPVFLRHDNLGQQPFESLVLSDGTLVVFFTDFMSGRGPLAHRRTWAARSSDGGRTFSIPLLVWEQADRESPWAAAVDRSPRHPDRLYVVVDGHWRREGPRPDDPPVGTRADLFVIASDDGGLSWSAPAAVTDSPAEADHETPAVAVSRDGVVGVAWYDTRHDESGAGRCFDVYFSASLDGGKTFLPNVRVTPETSCPASIEAQRGVAARWAFGGDYSGLAAGADGRFHLLWSDSRAGRYQLWSSSIRVGPAPDRHAAATRADSVRDSKSERR